MKLAPVFLAGERFLQLVQLLFELLFLLPLLTFPLLALGPLLALLLLALSGALLLLASGSATSSQVAFVLFQFLCVFPNEGDKFIRISFEFVLICLLA